MDEYLVGLGLDKLSDMKLYPLLKCMVNLPRYKAQIKQLVAESVSNIQIETKLLFRLKEIVNDNILLEVIILIKNDNVLNSISIGNFNNILKNVYPNIL